MSSIPANNTAVLNQQLQAQQQLLLEQTTNANQAANAKGKEDAHESQVAVPEDKDPTTYRAAYQQAISQGLTPEAAAKKAYKAAEPRREGDAPSAGNKDASSGGVAKGANGEPRRTGDSSKAEASAKGSATEKTNTTGAEAGKGIVANAPKDGVDPSSRPKQTPYVAQTPPTSTPEPILDEHSVGGVQSMVQEGKGNTAITADEFYHAYTADGKATPQAAEVATTDVTANLKPDAHGTVDAGSAGKIEMGDAAQRAAQGGAETQQAVSNTKNELVSNPPIVKALASSKSTDDTQAIVAQGIKDGIFNNLAPKDSHGNKVSTGPTSGGKKSSAKLNPMELVMVAMMEAAIEGQAQAADLAKQVQTNTDLKKSLRQEKTDLSNSMVDADGKKVSPTATSDSKNTAIAKDSALGKQQKAYQEIDDKLSNAGDDSSILMIKLQTAAQIVTTFLQACSNVSKGVTDTTKAVIGNIGH